MNTCKKRNCEKEVSGRKKYCSDSCKYWEGQLRKDDQNGLPPKNKRNKRFFYQFSSMSLGLSGQGKRSNGMVKGSMSSVLHYSFQIQDFNEENIRIYASAPHGLNHVRLCDGSLLGIDEAIRIAVLMSQIEVGKKIVGSYQTMMVTEITDTYIKGIDAKYFDRRGKKVEIQMSINTLFNAHYNKGLSVQ